MAEARSAVSFRDQVLDVTEESSALRDFAQGLRRSLLRGFFRTRNLIRNGMWPTSMYNLAVGIGMCSASLVGDWPIVRPINRCLWNIGKVLHIRKDWPYSLGIVAISCGSGVTFFIMLLYTRRSCLRMLLSYRGWMYEPPHRQSRLSNAWGVAVWMVSGHQPTTYSCQLSLPRLPVPPLNATVDGFLESIKPLYGEESEEYRNFAIKSQAFLNGVGPKLQRILVLKSWWAENYVTDWWEKYVYLMGRSPTPINSNYYVLDHARWCPTNKQVSRAASTIYQYLQFKRLIDRETLPPLLIRNIIPLCMAQYERLFSTTRIPGDDIDELVHFDSSVSKHIVVMRDGLYYKLDVIDADGQPLTPQNFEVLLTNIIEDADRHIAEYSPLSRSLAALTSLKRTDWAHIRSKYLANKINKDSLDIIETAIFHVILDRNSFDSWSEQGNYLMHGNGSTFWFDKSFSVVFFSNGKMGLNAEHSWGDAPVVGHLSEYNLTQEADCSLFDEAGNALPIKTSSTVKPIPPQRLVWNIPATLETHINEALAFSKQNNDDLELEVVEHDLWGKGFIKTCKVSPDAFLQMAFQYAYYKDSGGKFALTYESSMTRLYQLGRTETVRPLSTDAAEFVRSMIDKSKSNNEKISLLRTACDNHQLSYRNAMNGFGFDRHLFSLIVVCKGLGHESDFLQDALMLPWTLSTSQQPQQQMAGSANINDIKLQDKLCPGGGFGPVSDSGYGISYMFPSDHRFFFHVSSKKSSPATDSKRFVHLLFEALNEIKELFNK